MKYRLKPGAKIEVKETGERGTVIAKNDTAVHVRMKTTGEIKKFAVDAVAVITAIRFLIDAVKELIREIRLKFEGI